ncbi:HERV-H LTR-associating protein 1 [Brienomyrus brachyistius]|uniref:HERV-H LTR-associating protein 1 n=1 Tax=Brienomyrus brachyistius TaxID=42636 RepID=UPI0020B3CFF4|nr:HERV-H LTR-associating protein 1 [Brienomyrus brachyistius]
MAASGGAGRHGGLCVSLCVALIPLAVLYGKALKSNFERHLEKRDILVSTEIPAGDTDLASIDMTLLVNKLINSTQTGSQHIFTLLSITSHSSLAFNKLTVLVYNISNFRNIETSLLPMRYCYCLTNRSNDLTDFTAILLDIMGNSSSYLHEIFKSSSILSVSQNKDSDCIYICVMAGKTERDLSQLWEVESVKPLFNQTITADLHRGNITVPHLAMGWHHSLSGSSTDSSAQPSGMQNGSGNATTPARGEVTPSPSPTPRTVSPASFAERPRRVAGCPWKRPDISQVGTARRKVEPTASTAATPISAQKLQSCLLELCKFFSRCRCRDSDRGGAAR